MAGMGSGKTGDAKRSFGRTGLLAACVVCLTAGLLAGRYLVPANEGAKGSAGKGSGGNLRGSAGDEAGKGRAGLRAGGDGRAGLRAGGDGGDDGDSRKTLDADVQVGAGESGAAGGPEHRGAGGVDAASCAGACPQCPACPAAACPVCPSQAPCPGADALCAAARNQAAKLEKELGDLKESLDDSKKRRKHGGYEGPTAADRRLQAAKNDELLLELPEWGDDFTLSDDVVAQYGLTAEERARLEQTYREFRDSVYMQLRQILAELVGDPEAGADSTLNAIIHQLMELSPKDVCSEKLVAALALLSVGAPLPEPGPDAPACEVALYILFTAVDQLESQVTSSFGQKGNDALWSGASTFRFSSQNKKPQ